MKSLMSETHSSSSLTMFDDLEMDLPICLIIEDDIICRMSLVEKSKAVNLRPVEASSVREALTIIHEFKEHGVSIDIVFLDYILAENSTGLEFLKIIRSNNLLENALIVVMSGAVDNEIIKECYNYKILNFMKKPITKSAFYDEFAKMEKYLISIKCPLPDYSHIKKIGSSSKSVVTLVKNNFDGTLYAMKESLINDSNKAKNETQELNIYMALKCPTIIEIIDYSIENNKIYVIQELGKRGSLEKKIQKKKNVCRKFRTECIMDWISGLLLGALILQENNLIHKQINPSNLFFAENYILKIGEIGILKTTDSKDSNIDDSNLYYRAPETYLANFYSNKVDIWSLGVVLYELITLKRPFEDYDIDSLIKKISSTDKLPFPDNCDKHLKKLCQSMLTVDVNKRPTAKDIFIKYRFISNRIKKMFETGVFQNNENYNHLLSIIDPYTSTNMEGENNLSTLLTIEDKSQINESFITDNQSLSQRSSEINPVVKLMNNFKNAIALENLSPKTTFSSNILGYNSNYNAIKGSDIELVVDDCNINEKDLTSLLENKFLLNLSNPQTPEFDNRDKTFYEVRIFENSKIDNSIICDFNPHESIKDPVDLTCACLRRAEIALEMMISQFTDEEANNITKIDVIASRENLEFLYLIKKLNLLKLDQYTKQQRLACILNIYQTMLVHYHIKSIITEDKTSEDTYIEKFKNIWSSKDKVVNICYLIGNIPYTISDMKNIVIRKNRIPLNSYFRLAKSSDPRINILNKDNEDNLLKLHTVCLDPAIYSKLDSHFSSDNEKTSSDDKTKSISECKKELKGLNPSATPKIEKRQIINKRANYSNNSVKTHYSHNTNSSSTLLEQLATTKTSSKMGRNRHTYFRAETVNIQLDAHSKFFALNNFKFDDKEFSCPSLFKNYLDDFNCTENEMIRKLINLMDNEKLKPVTILKALNNKEMTVKYYY